jgi:hypothetical protein
VIAQLLYLPAGLALGAAFVLISLNAMRAGLLKRFAGILGVIVGGLVVFTLFAPQLGPAPLVQTIWLVMLASVLLNRGEEYPAWSTGRAEPWPSTPKRGRTAAPVPEPAPAPAAPAVTAASKRKRKRRK